MCRELYLSGSTGKVKAADEALRGGQRRPADHPSPAALTAGEAGDADHSY
jgi:hypothetical protein